MVSFMSLAKGAYVLPSCSQAPDDRKYSYDAGSPNIILANFRRDRSALADFDTHDTY